MEKAFIENQYPDQKRREELAKTCNEARPCSGKNSFRINYILNRIFVNHFLKFIQIEREKVTEQIITHWFQNKRKITRKGTFYQRQIKIKIEFLILIFVPKYL